MDADHILPNLLVGSCPTTTEDIDRLKRDLAVTAVLNLQTEDDFDFWGVDWEEMLARYQHSGIEVRRVPVQDFDPDDLRRKLPQCVTALDELLNLGHTVFLHCNAGVNRSPTVAIAYLCWIEGRTLVAATKHVMESHPCDPYLESIRLASEDWREGRDDSR
jgi:protein-tyrosine phosphatase